jgi:hypothetical protein
VASSTPRRSRGVAVAVVLARSISACAVVQ